MDAKHDWLDSSIQNDNISKQYKAGYRRRKILRVMRVILLLFVIIILGALFYSLKEGRQLVTSQDINNKKTSQNTETKGGIAMIKAKYSGLDEKQQPFNITADKASRSSDTPDVINLTKTMADILLQDGSWIAVHGDQGTYMQQHMQLFLNENVKLFHDTGYELLMDSLHIDLRKTTMRSKSNIIGHGPIGKIKAKGLEFTSSEDKIIFIGPAKLTLFIQTTNFFKQRK